MRDVEPEYLRPYLSAARRHGDGFKSLLWESPRTQGVRFHAMTRVCDFHGRSILDVGCGRADLLDWLRERRIEPEHYNGLEAVEPLARAAARMRRPGSLIVHGDFVRDPKRLFVGADVIAFSGSLNTLEPEAFYRTLGTAWEAATEAIVFNFLRSADRAGASYLYWHKPAIVKQFVAAFSEDVRLVDDYLDGDCTICVRKQLSADKAPHTAGEPPHPNPPNPLPRGTGGEGIGKRA